jgi:hypothetical protein
LSFKAKTPSSSLTRVGDAFDHDGLTGTVRVACGADFIDGIWIVEEIPRNWQTKDPASSKRAEVRTEALLNRYVKTAGKLLAKP